MAKSYISYLTSSLLSHFREFSYICIYCFAVLIILHHAESNVCIKLRFPGNLGKLRGVGVKKVGILHLNYISLHSFCLIIMDNYHINVIMHATLPNMHCTGKFSTIITYCKISWKLGKFQILNKILTWFGNYNILRGKIWCYIKNWPWFTFLTLSPLIMVRFEKFKSWHTQESKLYIPIDNACRYLRASAAKGLNVYYKDESRLCYKRVVMPVKHEVWWPKILSVKCDRRVQM